MIQINFAHCKHTWEHELWCEMGNGLYCPQAEKRDHKKRCRKKTGMRGDNRGLGQEQSGGFMASSRFFLLLVFFLSHLNKVLRESVFFQERLLSLVWKFTRIWLFLLALCLNTCLWPTLSALVILFLQCSTWKACLGRREKKWAARRRGGVYSDIN